MLSYNKFFDNGITATKVSEVGETIQTARSLRLSEIAVMMRDVSLPARQKSDPFWSMVQEESVHKHDRLWQKGLGEPLWVMGNLEPQRARQMYLARMKIGETFRDLKGLPGMPA